MSFAAFATAVVQGYQGAQQAQQHANQGLGGAVAQQSVCFINNSTATNTIGTYVNTGTTASTVTLYGQPFQSQQNDINQIDALTVDDLKRLIDHKSHGQMKVIPRLRHACMPRLCAPANFSDPMKPLDVRVVHGFKLDEAGAYVLPDGSCLEIDHNGNYVVNDDQGKVTYKATKIRDFNPFLNASDLLEQYITELKPLGVRQDEVLQLEIEHFINWLIHKAAEKDGDIPPADVPKLPPVALLTKQEAA